MKPGSKKHYILSALFIANIVFWDCAPASADQVFARIRTQFIAALGNPEANEGNGAENWGLWQKDPGPRGVWLKNYQDIVARGGVTPARWKFDDNEWWLDENGILMEKPLYALPPGRYIVTGDRETAAELTVFPKDANGEMRWKLADGVKLYDVTHLPCRSARYTPGTSPDKCTPLNASRAAFPVEPGGIMPAVRGCEKQDFSVLFIVAVAVDRQNTAN